MITCLLNPKKSNNERMLGAFAKGARVWGERVCVLDVHGKPVSLVQTRPGPYVFYGVDETTLPWWQAVQRSRETFIYIDNGYFQSKWKGGDHYRITVGKMQHSGLGPSNGKRWDALGLGMSEWRAAPADAPYLLALQSDFWYTRFGTTKKDWTRRVSMQLAPHLGERKIVVRDKTEHAIPINWGNVYAVVTHSSNVAVDGILEGVPCFTTSLCAATAMGGVLPLISTDPYYPSIDKRVQWARVLADNQWSTEEIASGEAWKEGK